MRGNVSNTNFVYDVSVCLATEMRMHTTILCSLIIKDSTAALYRKRMRNRQQWLNEALCAGNNAHRRRRLLPVHTSALCGKRMGNRQRCGGRTGLR